MSNIKIEDMQYFSDNWAKLYAASLSLEDTALSTFTTIVGGMPGSFTKVLTDIKSMSTEQLLAFRYKIINEDLTPMEVFDRYADSAYRNI